MDVKLGQSRRFDFDTVDPENGLPTIPVTIETGVYWNDEDGSMHTPPIFDRASIGTYTTRVDFTAANGFAVGGDYAVRVAVSFASGVYFLSLGNVHIVEYSTDDVGGIIDDVEFIRARAELITDSGVAVQSGFGEGANPPLTLLDLDDDVAANGGKIGFDADGFVEFPADSVKLSISVKGVNKLEIDCTTSVVSPSRQRVEFEITAEQKATLPKGMTPDYRIWCRYGEGAGQDKTIRRGVVQIESVATPAIMTP